MLITELKSKEEILSLAGEKAFIINCLGCKEIYFPEKEAKELQKELSDAGISILMISSEIAELERNCDRVIVMRDGRAVGEIIDKDINQDKIMELIAKGSESEGKKNG